MNLQFRDDPEGRILCLHIPRQGRWDLIIPANEEAAQALQEKQDANRIHGVGLTTIDLQTESRTLAQALEEYRVFSPDAGAARAARGEPRAQLDPQVLCLSGGYCALGCSVEADAGPIGAGCSVDCYEIGLYACCGYHGCSCENKGWDDDDPPVQPN